MDSYCKFNIGDLVCITSLQSSNAKYENFTLETQFVVTKEDGSSEHNVKVRGHGHNYDGWLRRDELELVGTTNNNKEETSMAETTTLAKEFLDKDTLVLIEQGYLNGDLTPTNKSIAAILNLNFKNMKADLIKLAKDEIKAVKETK